MDVKKFFADYSSCPGSLLNRRPRRQLSTLMQSLKPAAMRVTRPTTLRRMKPAETRETKTSLLRSHQKRTLSICQVLIFGWRKAPRPWPEYCLLVPSLVPPPSLDKRPPGLEYQARPGVFAFRGRR
jgi:hypothetical protein